MSVDLLPVREANQRNLSTPAPLFCAQDQISLLIPTIYIGLAQLYHMSAGMSTLKNRQSQQPAHRRYTRRINFREKWRGHLWQGRFASFVVDNPYLRSATRYVEQNPVRAGLVERAEQWPWSSARAHIQGKDDALVKVEPLVERFGRGRGWREFLSKGVTEYEADILRRHERTGRVLGEPAFLTRIETLIGRVLHRKKPGPKPKRKNN